MRILVADDDPITTGVIEGLLRSAGHEVTTAGDGIEALRVLTAPDAPCLAVLDWMMPGMSGVEIIREAFKTHAADELYVIVVTSKDEKQSVVEALGSGARDFLTKPFDGAELLARIDVGVRMLDLREQLSTRVRELEAALEHVKQLQRLLPICSYCKRIRDDKDYWQSVESYLGSHGSVRFSHGVCPDCYENVMKPEIDAYLKEIEKEKREGK